MIRKLVAFIALFAVMTVAFVGCGSQKADEETTAADNLYAIKNPYLENTKANNDLIKNLKVHSYGKYTLDVQDERHPYTLSIRFMYLNSGVDEAALTAYMNNVSIALLALIDDCEQINWSFPGAEGLEAGYIGTEYAGDLCGMDVKKAGKDAESFEKLYTKLFPEQQADAQAEGDAAAEGDTATDEAAQ